MCLQHTTILDKGKLQQQVQAAATLSDVSFMRRRAGKEVQVVGD